MRRFALPLAPVLALLALGCADDDGAATEASEASSSGGPLGSTGSPTSSTSAGSTGGTTSTSSGVGSSTDTGASTPSSTSSSTGAADDATTGGPLDAPPTGEAALLPWLEENTYGQWAAEPENHPTAGPHFQAVRTFVNDALLTSLEGGATEHPVGAAAVKELYGAGPELGGWAVLIKVAPGTDVDTWYWYEWFEGTTYADEVGNSGCGNCHALGLDYIRTPVPL